MALINMPEVTWLDNICLLILILAAMAWGAYGFFDLNVITYLPDLFLQKFVYGLIVFSGIKALFFWQNNF